MKTSARALIEQLGGVRAAAKRLGVAPSTASYWNTNDAIPAWRWPQIREALAREGEQ